MTENATPTTRKELMRPAQLLGLAAVCGLFAGGITAVSLGAFQDRATPGLNEAAHEVARQATVSNAVILGLVAFGIAFIAVLLLMSLMLLAVKPEDVTKTIDRPVLLPAEETAPEPAGAASVVSDAAARPENPEKPAE